jgi:hypothetical protein
MRLLIILGILLLVSPVLAIDEPSNDVPDTPLVEVVALGENYLVDDWQGFYTSQDDYSSRYAWLNHDFEAVVAIEQVHFLHEQDMDDYFGQNIERYFDITLLNYSPYDLVDDCELDTIQFYQFEGVFDDEAYLIYFYLWEKDDETMWSLSLYFPTDFEDELLETAEAFFPDFVSCDK